MNVFEDLDQEPGQPRLSDLWEWARDDYKAGESADVVCERHRLSRSQFFERARKEGWLRRDQPRRSAQPAYDAEVEAALVEHALDQPPPSAYALYRRAWAMLERALVAGRRIEAQGYARLARDLRKLALEEERTIYWHAVVKRHETPPTPDSPDSSLPPPFAGEVAAEGRRRGLPECDGQTEGGHARDDKEESASPLNADDEGAGARGAPSVTTAAQPRHLPRCAEEEEEPDSPDSGERAAPLNRAERRFAAKLARAGASGGGVGVSPARALRA